MSPKRSGTVLHGYACVLVESVNTTYRPEGVIVEEDSMSMEKRGVVNTEAEKKAHEQAKKKLAQTNTAKIPPKSDEKKEQK